MPILAILKVATSTIVGLGAYKVTGAIIKNNVPVESVIEKITVGSANIVIGLMVADATKSYTDGVFDQIEESWQGKKAVQS